MTAADTREAARSRTLARVSDAVISLNAELEYVFVNHQAEQLLEATEETLCGQYIWDAFPGGAGTIAETKVAAAAETGEQQTFERYNERLDRWFEARVYPDADGVSIFFSDITDRKTRETELAQYEQVIEALPVTVWVTSPNADGEFHFVNQAAVDMFGADSKAELQEYAAQDIYANAEDRRYFSNRVQEVGSMEGYETQLTTLAGESFWASLTAELVEIAGDNYIIKILKDISERKAEENELRYKTKAIEDAPLGMSLVDCQKDDNPLVYVNNRFEEMTGYAAEDIYGRNCRFLQGEDTSEDAVATLRTAVAAGDSATVELRNYRKDGEEFWNRLSIAPVTTDDGHSYYVGFQQDITEEKQRSLALAESNERIRAQNEALNSFADIAANSAQSLDQQITEMLELGTTYLDLDIGVLSHIEETTYTIRNVVSPDEMIESGDEFQFENTFCSVVYDANEPVSFHTPSEGDVEDHPAYQKQGIESYIGVPLWVAGERYGTLNFSQPDARDEPIRESEESFVRIIAQWIGTAIERTQHQHQITRTSEFLRETQAVAQVGSWEVGIQSNVVRGSDELYRIHGLPVDADLTPEDGIEFYHPEDRATIKDAFERLRTDGVPYDLELRLITADDETRWVRTRGEPQYEDGEIVRVRGTIQDITERKEREEQLQRENERLDEFASVIAHDLRNPLTVAGGRTALLQEMCEDDDVLDQLATIAGAIDRMGRIVEDTLTLAREGDTVGEMSPIPLADLIGNCWAGVETAHASLEIPDQCTICGDRDRLRHVFENLFRNAIEHGGDSVTVRVGRVGEEGIYVEDTGPGIPANARDEVLEAGHSSASGGTGFGLTIVKRIAEAHGWSVTITDGSDGGARFEFTSVGILDKK